MEIGKKKKKKEESPFKFSFFSLLDDHSLYLLYKIAISFPPIGQGQSTNTSAKNRE
jgi:hypothetical protein